jgi:hypothetical protein
VQLTGLTRLSGSMWLATLIICATSDVWSCAISSQPDSLYLTEEACLEEVALGISYFSASATYVSGGCVKIGSTA